MAEEKTNRLARDFTFFALFMFGVPSILLQLWTGIYQIFDTAIATNFNSTATLSAINIIYPVQAVIEAISFLISGGSTAVLGKMMGEKRDKEANQLFTFMLISSVLITLVWVIIVTLMGNNVWLMLGADAKLAPVCATYWSVHKYFMIVYCIQLDFQMWLLVAGKPTYCMVITIAGGLVTLAADFLYQAVWHMGTAGAALGFNTGVAFSAILSLVAVISHKNSLHYAAPKATPDEIWECFKLGLADFVYSAATAVMTAVYNIQAMKFYGEKGVAVAAIYLYAQFLFLAPFLGYGKGVGPIFSYLIGEKNYVKIKDIFKKYVKACLVLLVVFGVGSWFMAYPVLRIYVSPNSPEFILGKQKWLLFATCFVFVGINICIQDMLTAFNDTMMPLVISISRSLVMPILCLIVLPMIFGGNGIWIALTVAEAFTAIISVFFLFKARTKYHYM